jgi:uncharacterized membrane protein
MAAITGTTSTRATTTPWTSAAVIFLGAWLLTTPAIFDPRDTALAVSDAVSGALILLLGIWSLSPAGNVPARWAASAVGGWLLLAPLVFWAPTAFTYANDTLIGILVIAFTVLVPGVPGHAHQAIVRQPGPDIPPGWTYNPSSWAQRGPIIALAFLSFLIGRYMAAYQLGHITSVWEPFFNPGTPAVLTSDVSKAFPVPDAGLGAVSYLLEGLSGFMGGTARWRTLPWMVVLFAIMIVPLGVVSITLVVLQPVVVGAWCTPCLITALIMLIMIPLALDEVFATAQFLRRAKRAGLPLGRTFWIGGTAADAGAMADEATPPGVGLDIARQLVSIPRVPWPLALSALVGFWLMASPGIFGIDGALADSTHIAGPLAAVVAATAMAEVGRPVRYLNVFIGLWVILAAFLIGDATIAATVNAVACGALLMALSFPLGEVRDRYGGWQPFIV